MNKYSIEVDFSSTKKAVDLYMKKYKYYVLSVTDEPISFKDNLITIKYVDKYDKFITSRDKYNTKKEYVEWVNANINKLSELNRTILIHIYFNDYNDDVLANEIGYTRCYYYTLKKEAIINLAFSLNIEVIKENENEKC